MSRKSRKKKQQEQQTKNFARSIALFVPRAPAHAPLVDDKVHVFVDDQNLFFGITNNKYGKGFRIDFGRLLLQACQRPGGITRSVGSAYIAGVIPDDDSFWEIAKNQGFKVRRGYLGTNNRSKQDDAYLITDMVSTIFEQPGPSTLVLIAGDEELRATPAQVVGKRLAQRGRLHRPRHFEKVLEPVAHEIREIVPYDIQLASSIAA